jgi:hypothetical protein
VNRKLFGCKRDVVAWFFHPGTVDARHLLHCFPLKCKQRIGWFQVGSKLLACLLGWLLNCAKVDDVVGGPVTPLSSFVQSQVVPRLSLSSYRYSSVDRLLYTIPASQTVALGELANKRQRAQLLGSLCASSLYTIVTRLTDRLIVF